MLIHFPPLLGCIPGEKTALFFHFYIEMIILPRQARDKHRENSKRDRFLAANCKHMQQQWAALEALYTAKRAKAIGAKNGIFEPFIYKTDQFTKTGLGQT